MYVATSHNRDVPSQIARLFTSQMWALPFPQQCHVMWQCGRSFSLPLVIPPKCQYLTLRLRRNFILSSLLQLPTGTGSGLACHHVLSRSRLVPLTKLCASIAPRKYTCIRTPTWRGSDLFPGSSQRSYRQGAIRVLSSSGPRLEELLSFGQALRRNTGGYSLNIQHVHVNVSTLCF